MHDCPRRIRTWQALALLASLATGCTALDEAPASRRVLVVTGEDYAGHQWRQTSQALAASLARDPRLSIEIHDDLSSLHERDLSRFAAVVLHFKNYDPDVPGRAAFDNLVRYSERGGGLVLTHFACGAFEEFADEYERLVGRVWIGELPPPGRFQHDPYGPFEVRIVAPEHPALSGTASFTTRDELYTCLQGSEPIEVLAEAVSVRDQRAYPLDLVLKTPTRRVFHCVLGHDVAALTHPPVAELYRHGTSWAAGLTPAANTAAAREETR